MRITVSDSVGLLNVSDDVGTLNVSDSLFSRKARQSNMFIKKNGALKRVVFGDKNKLFPPWYCTVSNLGSENPTNVTFTHNKTMPTFEQVTVNNNVFIKIPTMYRKVNTVVDGQITSFTISEKKLDNNFKPYPCFIDESGNLLPYILIGKYMSSSDSELDSQGTAGQTSGSVKQTLENARANLQPLGTGYQLYDWQMQKLWQDLIICKMNTVNTTTSSGITTDELGFEWEKTGNWIDGIIKATNEQWYVSYKPSEYVSLSTASDPLPETYIGTSLYAPTTSSNYEIKKLGYDSNNPFVNYPVEQIQNTSFNTYYCDSYYFNTIVGNRPMRSNVGGTEGNYGAFWCLTFGGWQVKVGVRLCYRPIS